MSTRSTAQKLTPFLHSTESVSYIAVQPTPHSVQSGFSVFKKQIKWSKQESRKGQSLMKRNGWTGATLLSANTANLRLRWKSIIVTSVYLGH